MLNNKPLFPKKKIIGTRDWGKEELLVLIPKVLTLKKLTIKRNNGGNLQYHRKKNECGYIVSGKLKVLFDNGKKRLISKILKKGDTFHFRPGTIHQEIAITNCVIIEASTPHFNDRVRVENIYGLKKLKGLPTTLINEIIKK